MTPDQSGRTIVITGASSGIGAAAARRLALAGANVVPVGRSPERTARIAAEIGSQPLVADFADLSQVRDLAERVLDSCPRIDVLVNNAGGLFHPRQVSADGNEMTLQVNHLAGFLLTDLLLPRLRESARTAPVRVVTTSSVGNRLGRLRLDDLQWERRRYGGGYLCYCVSKLMNVLFTRELARRSEGTGIEAVCFNPDPGDRKGQGGGSAEHTRLFAGGPLLARLVDRSGLQMTGDDGAEPLLWLATDPDPGGGNGAYFDGFTPGGKVNLQADDPALARRLWEMSAELTGV